VEGVPPLLFTAEEGDPLPLNLTPSPKSGSLRSPLNKGKRAPAKAMHNAELRGRWL
jgi:hypothetical protein